jgi:hypothetical protein
MQHPDWILGYHGCDRLVGEKILAGQAEVHVSANEYDWLGQGAYFWENSYERALHWAESLRSRSPSRNRVKRPFVIGAIIDPGNCLDLSEAGCLDILKEAADKFLAVLATSKSPVPRNEGAFASDGDLVKRKLDCAVINFLHTLRQDARQEAFDTVRCPFFEGEPLYEGAMISARTHVQWCIREPKKNIIAYFRPRVAFQ